MTFTIKNINKNDLFQIAVLLNMESILNRPFWDRPFLWTGGLVGLGGTPQKWLLRGGCPNKTKKGDEVKF